MKNKNYKKYPKGTLVQSTWDKGVVVSSGKLELGIKWGTWRRKQLCVIKHIPSTWKFTRPKPTILLTED